MNTNHSGFEHPEETVDLVIFSVNEEKLKALLVMLAAQPFAGYWCIPGGCLRTAESLEDTAIRAMIC